MFNSKLNLWYLGLLSLLALTPQFLMRMDLDIAWWFYSHLTTYYGDLWYCWENYLNHGFPYPREYPAGIQLLFRLLYLIPGVITNYNEYFIIICAILTSIFILSNLYMYKMLSKERYADFLWLWLFSPSVLIYILMNLDILPICTIIVAYYCFNQRNYRCCAILIALGATIKVFPIFLFPVYFFAIPIANSCKVSTQRWVQHLSTNLFARARLRFLFLMLICWVLFNLPFIVLDSDAWSFPYLWQIQENFARNAHSGSWTWLLFQLCNQLGVGSISGKLTLILFASLYFYLVHKYWNLPLCRRLVIVMLLFLLTDRIYSPQYNLYLLVFLALVDYKVNWRWFYLLELPNLTQLLFTFYLTEHAIILQAVISLKYLAMLLLLRDNLQQSVPNLAGKD